jgi:hypothetical protein
MGSGGMGMGGSGTEGFSALPAGAGELHRSAITHTANNTIPRHTRDRPVMPHPTPRNHPGEG